MLQTINISLKIVYPLLNLGKTVSTKLNRFDTGRSREMCRKSLQYCICISEFSKITEKDKEN